MYCPMDKNRCIECACAWWSGKHEECAVFLIGEGAREIAYAADDANLDCGIRVHVTREEMVSDADC